MVRQIVKQSKFVKVKCKDCNSEQVVYGNAAMKIKCLVCGKTIARPRSGKTEINAEIMRILD